MAREFQNTSWYIHTNSSLCREMVSPLTPCFNSYTGGSLTMRFHMHSSSSLLHECTALSPVQVAPSPNGSVCRVHYSSNSLLHSPHRELTTLSCCNTKVCAHHFHIKAQEGLIRGCTVSTPPPQAHLLVQGSKRVTLGSTVRPGPSLLLSQTLGSTIRPHPSLLLAQTLGSTIRPGLFLP